jgi:hypothetical protein
MFLTQRISSLLPHLRVFNTFLFIHFKHLGATIFVLNFFKIFLLIFIPPYGYFLYLRCVLRKRWFFLQTWRLKIILRDFFLIFLSLFRFLLFQKTLISILFLRRNLFFIIFFYNCNRLVLF